MEFCGPELTLPFTSQLTGSSLWCKGKLNWFHFSLRWIPKKKQPRQVKACSGSQFQTHSLSRWRGGHTSSTRGEQLVTLLLQLEHREMKSQCSADLLLGIHSVTPTAWDEVSYIQGGSPSSANPFLETPLETHPEGYFHGDPKHYQLDSEDEQSQVPCSL